VDVPVLLCISGPRQSLLENIQSGFLPDFSSFLSADGVFFPSLIKEG